MTDCRNDPPQIPDRGATLRTTFGEAAVARRLAEKFERQHDPRGDLAEGPTGEPSATSDASVVLAKIAKGGL